MNSSIAIPAQPQPWKNSLFSLPKKPSHLALSGEYLRGQAPVFIAARHRLRRESAPGGAVQHRPLMRPQLNASGLGLKDAAVLMAARMLVSPMSTHAVLWTMRSMIASAVTSAPSRACQSFCRYWVQKIVDLSSQQSPEISSRKRRKPAVWGPRLHGTADGGIAHGEAGPLLRDAARHLLRGPAPVPHGPHGQRAPLGSVHEPGAPAAQPPPVRLPLRRRRAAAASCRALPAVPPNLAGYGRLVPVC